MEIPSPTCALAGVGVPAISGAARIVAASSRLLKVTRLEMVIIPSLGREKIARRTRPPPVLHLQSGRGTVASRSQDGSAFVWLKRGDSISVPTPPNMGNGTSRKQPRKLLRSTSVPADPRPPRRTSVPERASTALDPRRD